MNVWVIQRQQLKDHAWAIWRFLFFQLCVDDIAVVRRSNYHYFSNFDIAS